MRSEVYAGLRWRRVSVAEALDYGRTRTVDPDRTIYDQHEATFFTDGTGVRLNGKDGFCSASGTWNDSETWLEIGEPES